MSKLNNFLFLVGFFAFGGASAGEIKLKNINLAYNDSYAELKAKGFKPRKDVDYWPFSIPLNWSSDPYGDRNWVFQLQAWRMMDPILKEYVKTKDGKYLVEAVNLALDWFGFYRVNPDVNKMQWYDMSAGIRAMKLAWISQELDKQTNLFSEKDREIIRVLVRDHIEKLLDDSFIANGNHAFFQLVGLRLLCSSGKEVELCAPERKFNERHMQALLERQFTSEGVHRENSPAYHFFTLKTIQQLNINALYGANVNELILRASKVSPYLVYPDATVSRVGDSSGKYNVGLEFSDPPAKINGSEFIVGDFLKSGYFSIRTLVGAPLRQSSQLFIKGVSFPDEAHAHADELSFELFHRGRLVLVDSGKYAYQKDDFREYVLSAAAHNTVSRANMNSGPSSIDKDRSEVGDAVVSDAGVSISGYIHRPGQFSHRRFIEFMPFSRLQIFDEFEVDDSGWSSVLSFFNDPVFLSNLHVNPELKVRLLDSKTVEVVDYVTINLVSSNCVLRVVRGQKDPLIGWVSFSYNEISQASVVQAECTEKSGSLAWDVELH